MHETKDEISKNVWSPLTSTSSTFLKISSFHRFKSHMQVSDDVLSIDVLSFKLSTACASAKDFVGYSRAPALVRIKKWSEWKKCAEQVTSAPSR